MKAKLTLQKGDITRLKVDAIVNAANSALSGGGGVDGAIHRAGGPAISEACREIRNRQGGCPTGEAVITTGGNLPARYVIHTVGPVWNGGHHNEEELLANAYRNTLALAVGYKVHRIAFPNISTGVYHFPKPRAAAIAVAEAKKFAAGPGPVEEIIFVCFDDENYRLYEDLLND